MEDGHHHNDHNACCNTNNNSSLRQSLSELEFERGIWFAAQHNDLDRVKFLLKKGVSADIEDSAGYTALHYAARNGHSEVCKILLENRACVNKQTRCGRATALHRAATQGRISIVELLLNSGANANLKDVDDYTPLHRGMMAGAIEVCKLLIPRTDLSQFNSKGHTIEQLAKEICPAVLPFISMYVAKKEKSMDDG